MGAILPASPWAELAKAFGPNATYISAAALGSRPNYEAAKCYVPRVMDG